MSHLCMLIQLTTLMRCQRRAMIYLSRVHPCFAENGQLHFISEDMKRTLSSVKHSEQTRFVTDYHWWWDGDALVELLGGGENMWLSVEVKRRESLCISFHELCWWSDFFLRTVCIFMPSLLVQFEFDYTKKGNNIDVVINASSVSHFAWAHIKFNAEA